MPRITLKQARAMRDGILKGDSEMAKAWKELIEGGASEDVGPFVVDEADPDTSKERKALGIPPRPEPVETEGY